MEIGMKKIFLALLTLVFVALPSLTFAASIIFTNGFWSTSFECTADELVCDKSFCGNSKCADEIVSCGNGVYTPFGGCNDTSCNNSQSEITLSANNPNGEGGRGYRMHVGPGAAADQSGYPAVNVPNLKEFWVRWYMRTSPQMNKAGKVFFPHMNNRCQPYWISPKNFREYWQINPQNCGSYGGSCADIGSKCDRVEYLDGNWHMIELHYRVSGGSLFVETWFDGNYAGNLTTPVNGSNFYYLPFFQSIKYQSACDCPSGCTLDFDDVAIALRSYKGFVTDARGHQMIGPVTGGR
jgi:hypothetical protein